MIGFLQRFYAWATRQDFSTSADYWRRRYARGGNSGAGSYGRLARFKADVLNELVRAKGIGTVIELGSGDGSQLALAEYPHYIGVDISPEALAASRARFAGDSRKTFIALDDFRRQRPRAELALSLDVIYHLVEDKAFAEHMQDLFGAAERFVAIYSSNADDLLSPAPHVRHRRFTDWIEQHYAGWHLLSRHKNPYPFSWLDRKNTSPADLFVFARR
jgi:SAM-dependent methyltransferase